MNIAPHAAWKPHTITAIDCASERTGFIGRALATMIDGVEVIIHARTVDDLAAAWGTISGKVLDEERIYKATMIHSEGIEIVITETPAEVPVAPSDTAVHNEPVETERFFPADGGEPTDIKSQMDFDNEEL